MFSQYTVPQLKSIIKQYNIHTKISNYSKMRKELLILEMEKYLTCHDNKITVKENNFDITVKPENKIKKVINKNVEKEIEDVKNEPQLLSLGNILKLIKKLDKGEIGEDKKSLVKSLIYSLSYKYDNYTPEMIKKYKEIYKFLGTNLLRMKFSTKQEKIIEKLIYMYYTQQEELKEKKKNEKYFYK